MSLRYLVRFTLVDVATGEWATWSPVNYESKVIFPQIGNKNSDSLDVAEQQISQLKQKTYAAGKKISVQHLTCLTPGLKLVFNTLLMQGAETTTPRSGGTHAGRLTTNDSKSIEVAMRNHTIHPQGRDSYNLNKYIWRFIALSTAQPRVIHIVATSEQEARQQSPDGCVMVFAARIRQEVHHVQ